VAAGVGYAWWATSFRPFTSATLTATFLGGLGALAVGSVLEPVPLGRPGVPERNRGRAAWLVLFLAAAGWELAAFLQHPRSEHPTLSFLANQVLGDHPIRTLAMAVWLAIGVRIARR
jgi:hypothetical protein